MLICHSSSRSLPSRRAASSRLSTCFFLSHPPTPFSAWYCHLASGLDSPPGSSSAQALQRLDFPFAVAHPQRAASRQLKWETRDPKFWVEFTAAAGSYAHPKNWMTPIVWSSSNSRQSEMTSYQRFLVSQLFPSLLTHRPNDNKLHSICIYNTFLNHHHHLPPSFRPLRTDSLY